MGSFSVAGAAVEGVGEGGGMRCASATAPAVSGAHSRKLPVGSRPPPAQQREALQQNCMFSVLGEEAILRQLRGKSFLSRTLVISQFYCVWSGTVI